MTSKGMPAMQEAKCLIHHEVVDTAVLVTALTVYKEYLEHLRNVDIVTRPTGVLAPTISVTDQVMWC